MGSLIDDLLQIYRFYRLSLTLHHSLSAWQLPIIRHRIGVHGVDGRNGHVHQWTGHAMLTVCVWLVQEDYSQVESMAGDKQKEVESLLEELTEVRATYASPELQVLTLT